MKVSRPLRLLRQCLGWPVAGSHRVAVGPCMQPPPGPRPGGGRWAAPFEAPRPAGGAGPCQLQPPGYSAGRAAVAFRWQVDLRARPGGPLSGGGRRAGQLQAPGTGTPGPATPARLRLAWGETRGVASRTIRSCQRRLARLAPMGAKAGPAPVPGPEADPVPGAAASCESRAQMVPSAPVLCLQPPSRARRQGPPSLRLIIGCRSPLAGFRLPVAATVAPVGPADRFLRTCRCHHEHPHSPTEPR